jgi:predicted alpha/beta-fold hydrolase
METEVGFHSDGLKLAGIVHIPHDLGPGERRAAFVILHGFGGNKDGHGQTVMAEQLTAWGYVTMRIDFRGCGESEGEHGRIICLDQVADTSSAVTYMASRPEVDPDLYRRGRSTRGGGHFLWGLGGRRAQIPSPASNARGMGAFHDNA